mgnify:CR=1 FL=1
MGHFSLFGLDKEKWTRTPKMSMAATWVPMCINWQSLISTLPSKFVEEVRSSEK